MYLSRRYKKVGLTKSDDKGNIRPLAWSFYCMYTITGLQLAWLSVHLAGFNLKLFLEGLDELKLVTRMAYSGHGLFTANHDATVLCITLHIYVYK
jgi:hypothetical protein